MKNSVLAKKRSPVEIPFLENMHKHAEERRKIQRDAYEQPPYLLESKKRLVEEAREHARSQKDLWVQVPYLALQAYGRNKWGIEEAEEGERECNWAAPLARIANWGMAFPSAFYNVFMYGYWEVGGGEPFKSDFCTVFVDCATGELVDSAYPNKPADDWDIFSLLISPGRETAIIDQGDVDEEDRIPPFYFSQLDAAQVVEMLQRKIATLHDVESCFCRGARGRKKISVEEWRKETARRKGLKPIYVRKRHFTCWDRVRHEERLKKASKKANIETAEAG